MRQIMLLFLMISLASCDLFSSKEKQTDKTVNEKLLAIDWNDVDQFPLFDACSETASKEIQRDCFETQLLLYFNDAFKGLTWEVEQALDKVMFIDFLIDEHGFISVLGISDTESIERVIPNFVNQMEARLNELTTVAPALKRGIPVSMKFRLPIHLNTTS